MIMNNWFGLVRIKGGFLAPFFFVLVFGLPAPGAAANINELLFVILYTGTACCTRISRHQHQNKQTIQTNVRINRDRDFIGSGFGVRGLGYSLSNR